MRTISTDLRGRPAPTDLGSAPRTPEELIELGDLLFDLAVGLHRAGASATHLESALGRSAKRLGLRAQILGTPTSLLVDMDDGRGVRLARVEPGEPNLERLADIDSLLEELEEGQVGPRRALYRLRSIVGRRPSFGPGLELAAVGVASGSATVFFGGGAADVAVAGGLGVAVAVMGRLSTLSEHRRPLFEPGAALLAAAATTALARLGLPIAPLIVTLAALIVLVPGYSLTIALGEIAARHLVSGTARLAGVMGTLLGMGLGIGLGRALGSLVPLEVAHSPTPLGEWALWSAVVIASLCFSVLFHARLRDVPIVMLATVTAFVGARAGAVVLGPELGGFAGALVLGLMGNLVARRTRRPASTVVLPGLMVLVPGSIGFRAVALFLESAPLDGLATAFQTAIVGSSLVAGLLAANMLLPPRRSL
ncbi:threonine/serine ThrE exporter family protein [Engelhardtia mirabilis]|uniref:Threonine/serine exporter family protein n=1 Tax=Engelhardtia mirabilis TaxID=2528011 RepID=A0A518BKJ0_9BACT|nr:hypothetical protein Pla133_25750 [Planctomycetes bacterium Pla133]QDV01817.1 hypothetical protein Pla86_25740 [Planctomycetes bacterium Pla86]